MSFTEDEEIFLVTKTTGYYLTTVGIDYEGNTIYALMPLLEPYEVSE